MGLGTLFGMAFSFLDAWTSDGPDSAQGSRRLRPDEDYLADHFPSFPIMPGVLMVEALVQTARRLLEQESGGHWVLGEAKAVRYGALVQPGMVLRTSITVKKRGPDGIECKGEGLRDDGQTAVSGRFIMRPLRPAQSGPQTLNTGVEQ